MIQSRVERIICHESLNPLNCLSLLGSRLQFLVIWKQLFWGFFLSPYSALWVACKALAPGSQCYRPLPPASQSVWCCSCSPHPG